MQAVPARRSKPETEVERIAWQNVGVITCGGGARLKWSGCPLAGTPWGHSDRPEPRRIESKPALGKTTDRLSAGEEIKLISSFP